ncbi:hypothetical protein M569_04572 [Genlisea aurea]|uniref:DUF4378 domain-containing protein n=1 Tax=Genlisea aurea TaxID=192259 RepID=S8CTL9_9LAMI|nr:hypothetical protein M569_04572 [Genlisea aurea]
MGLEAFPEAIAKSRETMLYKVSLKSQKATANSVNDPTAGLNEAQNCVRCSPKTYTVCKEFNRSNKGLRALKQMLEDQTEDCIRYLSDRFNSSRLELVQSSWILGDSKMFEDPEEMEEDPIKARKWKLKEKNDKKNLSQKNIAERIVLDMENEILIRKLTMGGLFKSKRERANLQTIMKEVSLEIGHRCNMPCWNLYDEDDSMIKLLSAELKYQLEDWKDFGDEVPYLVLDIERHIFKDLMNEVVIG